MSGTSRLRKEIIQRLGSKKHICRTHVEGPGRALNLMNSAGRQGLIYPFDLQGISLSRPANVTCMVTVLDSFLVIN
jgi:hypothetical protein